METLELPGYSEDQKMMIAKEFLIPKQINEHGLSSEFIEFQDAALQTIISSYTREAGVRNLEREIATICRGVAKDVARGIKEKVVDRSRELAQIFRTGQILPRSGGTDL